MSSWHAWYICTATLTIELSKRHCALLLLLLLPMGPWNAASRQPCSERTRILQHCRAHLLLLQQLLRRLCHYRLPWSGACPAADQVCRRLLLHSWLLLLLQGWRSRRRSSSGRHAVLPGGMLLLLLLQGWLNSLHASLIGTMHPRNPAAGPEYPLSLHHSRKRRLLLLLLLLLLLHEHLLLTLLLLLLHERLLLVLLLLHKQLLLLLLLPLPWLTHGQLLRLQRHSIHL